MYDLVRPTSGSVKELLALMYGDDLAVKSNVMEDLEGRHIATFLDDDDELVAVCACTLPFVAFTGAALSMVPADTAEEMAKNDDISEMVAANFYEVMNICSRLIMSDDTTHLRLDKTMNSDDGAECLEEFLEEGPDVLGFDVDIPGYGTGNMALLLVA